MIKKLKNIMLILILLLAFSICNVSAAGGTATVNFAASSSTVTKGGNVTINVNISSLSGAVDDKMVSFGGNLNFDPEYLQYTGMSGANGFSLVDINPDNSYKFYFMTTGSGVSSGNIGSFTFKTLKSGQTTVSVSSPSGTDKRSNLTVSVNGSNITINEPAPVLDSNSKLSALSVDGFSISPTFNSNTKNYTLTVPRDTTSVKINATAASSKAKSVTGTGTKSLTGESTTFSIVCTAENDTSTTYKIVVTKEAEQQPDPQPQPTVKSSDSSLKSLDAEGYTISPSFKPDTTSYTMTVSNGITGLNITAVPNDPKASYEVSGDSKWDVGKNTVKITVTAEDGSTTVYKLVVTRQAAKVKSSDTNVKVDIKSSHTINPEFSNSVNSYDLEVPYEVSSLDMIVTPFDSKTKVKISGNENFSTDNINKVTIKVTAEDGTSKTITFNVKRNKEKANTDLISLKVKNHTISPTFKPSVTKYKTTVKYEENEVEVIVKAPEGATYEITGNKFLKVGKNVVLVKVTDKNGYNKYYQIDITKEPKKEFKIFGLGLIPFLLILFLLLLLLLLLILLLRRKKQKTKVIVKKEPVDDAGLNQTAPIHIDFNPEFNFNSKNGTDDDVIYSEGDLINGTDVQKLPYDEDENVKEADISDEDESNDEEENEDIYDDVVTKDELVDALNESIETKNTDKLKMLLDQENLNRRKERIKKNEELKKKMDSDEDVFDE